MQRLREGCGPPPGPGQSRGAGGAERGCVCTAVRAPQGRAWRCVCTSACAPVSVQGGGVLPGGHQGGAGGRASVPGHPAVRARGARLCPPLRCPCKEAGGPGKGLFPPPGPVSGAAPPCPESRAGPLHRAGPAPGGRTGGTWSRSSAPRPGLCPGTPRSRGPALSRAPDVPASPVPLRARGQSRDRARRGPVPAGGRGSCPFLVRSCRKIFLFASGAQPRREGPAAPASLSPPRSPPRSGPAFSPPQPFPVGFNARPGGRKEGRGAAPPQPGPSGVSLGAPPPPPTGRAGCGRAGGAASREAPWCWVKGGGEQTGRPPRGGRKRRPWRMALPPGG